MTIDELIARLAAAEGPSRELDLAICRGALNSEPLGHAAGMDDSLLLMQRVGLYPRYTSSIDAALTLYRERPAFVSTDPRQACITALKAGEKELSKIS